MAIHRKKLAYDLCESKSLGKKWNTGKNFYIFTKNQANFYKKRIFYLDSACVKAYPNAAGA